MKILKNSYIFIALCSSILCADYTDVSVWKRNTLAGEPQLLVVCGDTHEPEQVGCDQSEDIAHLLANYAREGDAIIVEDLHDIKGLARRLDHFFDEYPHEVDRAKAQRGTTQVYEAYEKHRAESARRREQAALYVLPYFARNQNIPVVDIDFREFISIGAPRLNVQEYENGHLIVPWMLEQVVAEVAAFNDTPSLNEVYADIIERFTPFMVYVCDVMRQKGLIYQDLPEYFTDYCLAHSDKFDIVLMQAANTIDFGMMHHNLQLALNHIKAGKATAQTRKDLLWIFSELLNLSTVELIDAMVLHALYTKQVNVAVGNTVFICAGEAHTAIVEKHLASFGYEHIESLQDMQGVDMVAALEPIMQYVCSMQSNNFVNVIYAMVDGVKSAFDAVGSFFGLA